MVIYYYYYYERLMGKGYISQSLANILTNIF